MSYEENMRHFLRDVCEAVRSGRTRLQKVHKINGSQELHRPGGWVKTVRILDHAAATVLADFDLPLERLPNGLRLEIGGSGEPCPAGQACPAGPLLRIGQGEQAVDVLADCLADGDLLEELVEPELELHSLTSQDGWDELRREYAWHGRLYADNKGLHCRLTVCLKAS